MLDKIAEKFGQHFAGAAVWFQDGGIEIEVLEKVNPQFRVQAAPLSTVLQERAGLFAGGVRSLDPGSDDGGFAGFDDVPDLQVDDAADDEIAPDFIRQFAM